MIDMATWTGILK